MKICKVENCNNNTDKGGKGYCNKHWHHIVRHGKILKRTKRDPNEIVTKKDYAEIILYRYNPEAFEVARTKIDLDDIEKCKEYKWHLTDTGYAITNLKSRKRLRLHIMILGKNDGKEIDHINGDTLDNRKSNLRHCYHRQNTRNRKAARGYFWDKEKKKWKAHIMINYKNINLGYFNNKKDAISARKEAENKYFGEFAHKK